MNRTRRILVSLVVIAVVASAAVLGTSAFFSDTETSTGNVLSAGAIDLLIDNESYVVDYLVPEYQDPDGSLVESPETTWLQATDLTDELFFNFFDLKPGDWGEDTISVHVNNNDAYVCAQMELTENEENQRTEPEIEFGDSTESESSFDGELAQNISFFWWPDDGDNVLEQHEAEIVPPNFRDGDQLFSVPLSVLMEQDTMTLVDSQYNFFTGAFESPEVEPLAGGTTEHVGKAWCLGDMTMNPYEDDEDTSPIVRPNSVSCDGTSIGNDVQTDHLTGNVSFYAVQARHNDGFLCSSLDESVQFSLDRENSLGLGHNNVDEPMPGAEQFDQPWIEWDTSTPGEITFTFHNPTDWLYVFDVRVDGESGTDRNIDGDNNIATDLQISDPPLAPQEFGETYQRVVVDGSSSTHVETQTFTGSDEIQVGLREGAEQHGYIDWIIFTAN